MMSSTRLLWRNVTCQEALDRLFVVAIDRGPLERELPGPEKELRWTAVRLRYSLAMRQGWIS